MRSVLAWLASVFLSEASMLLVPDGRGYPGLGYAPDPKTLTGMPRRPSVQPRFLVSRDLPRMPFTSTNTTFPSFHAT